MKGSRLHKRANVRAGMSVSEFMEEMLGAGFTAKRLSEGVEIYKMMVDDKKCVKVLTAAGALVAGGMRNVFVSMIRAGLVDVFIATGGSILTHDLMEAFGVEHKQGSAYVDDAALAEQNVIRIYDVFLDEKGYSILEEELFKILPRLAQEEMAPNYFLKKLGEQIEDKNSIVRACADMNVPIFCPSITDSMLGFHVWMFSQKNKLSINPQLDIRDIMEVVWQDKKFGALILSGGVPKHFIVGMMQAAGKGLDYAVQVTMDRPEHGGLSGANLSEAKSWKKVEADAPTSDIMCDVTLAFPLIVACLLDHVDQKTK